MASTSDGLAATLRALWPSRRSDPIDYHALLPERYDVDVKDCYEMDCQIGQGGFAKVMLARDKHCDGRIVAIKKVVKKNPRHVEKLHTEAQVMKKLDHPNICRLHESFEDEKHMFFVMELCAGGELLERIMQNKRIDEPIAAAIIDQVAHALRYAHNHKVAHRDLKPENVCFCSKDESDTTIKVIDWGLSALFAEEAMCSAVGTFMYTAPEVLACIGKKTRPCCLQLRMRSLESWCCHIRDVVRTPSFLGRKTRNDGQNQAGRLSYGLQALDQWCIRVWQGLCAQPHES